MRERERGILSKSCVKLTLNLPQLFEEKILNGGVQKKNSTKPNKLNDNFM